MGIMMGCDPSGRGTDETSWWLVDTITGTIYILDCAYCVPKENQHVTTN